MPKRKITGLGAILTLSMVMCAQAASQQIVDWASLQTLLESNAPTYHLELFDGESSQGLSALEGAGIIKQYGASPNCDGEHLRLALTPMGERIAKGRKWTYTAQALDIPVGRFVPVSGAVSTRRQSMTLYIRFDANTNAAYLDGLASPSTWKVTSWPTKEITLSDAGTIMKAQVPVVRDYAGRWVAYIRANPLSVHGCSYDSIRGAAYHHEDSIQW